MEITTHRINARGLSRIREWLDDNHKGATSITDDMLPAWASSAEEDMDEDRSPIIEIRAAHSISGAPVTLSLGCDDFDAETVEAD